MRVIDKSKKKAKIDLVMATATQIVRFDEAISDAHAQPDQPNLSRIAQIAGVFRGRELTRKDRKIASGLRPIDNLLNGGVAMGRISEIIGHTGSGRTSLAAAFAAAVTRNQAAAWIDAAGEFDHESIARAGVNPARLLWISCESRRAGTAGTSSESGRRTTACLKAAEWILATGGFGLVVMD